MRSKPLSEGMVVRRVLVRARDVAYLKAVIDSREGLAHVFGEEGGDLTVATPLGREEELDELLAELLAEVAKAY